MFCFFFIDKSLGDTSDIISDSSGVGTSSDSTACSIGHLTTTVVCMETYSVVNKPGHLRLNPGDLIDILGSTDCGLLEGCVRGSDRTGVFPVHCVQEINLRQKDITNVSTSQLQYNSGGSSNNSCSNNNNIINNNLRNVSSMRQHSQYSSSNNQQYNSSTAPRIKKT